MPERKTRRTTPRQPNVGSVVPIVKRLMAIDALLAGDGLCVLPAAEHLGLADKTVRRHLYHLRELAGPTVCEIDEAGRYLHRYAKGVKPLFAASLNRKRR